MRKAFFPALLALGAVVVFALGWFLGRYFLERAWSNPVRLVTKADYDRGAVEGADPTPKEGTSIIVGLPLKKMRAFMAGYVEKDPVVAGVSAFGRDGTEQKLHIVLHNKGTCKVKEAHGVAYGYDAWGRAVTVNKGGERYVAFHAKELSIEPGGKATFELEVKNAGTSSLAAAHVDEVICEGGKTWKRG